MIDVQKEVLIVTGASGITAVQSVQTLWSGYGEIKRYELAGGEYSSVIVKHIQWPEKGNHPRGWNTSVSHQRKLKSYQIERCWYEKFTARTNEKCKVPQLYHSSEKDSELVLIMEDLDHIGYDRRLNPANVQLEQVVYVLSWLAHFHATFLSDTGKGLWEIGTYWHLDTRPEEWEKMQNLDLKRAAQGIDARLGAATYKTLVHGDAKLANFCFKETGEVAAVDFQYVGRGCGMKDVAYFLSSCFDEEECERYETKLLAHYFQELKTALPQAMDFEHLKEEWTTLYPYAWADFYRFLDGWSPGHWKMHGYSKKLTSQVIDSLK